MADSEKSENTPKIDIWQTLARQPRRHWFEVIFGSCSFCDFHLFGEGEPTCPDCATRRTYLGAFEGIWFEDEKPSKKRLESSRKRTSDRGVK